MNFIYQNSNISGIGDRLIDVILIYTYCKFLNYNKCYLNWIEDNHNMIYNNHIHTILRKNKTPFREKDYLLENLKQFLILPDDILFLNKHELDKKIINKEDYIFNTYMGVKYSVFTFVDKYLFNEDDKTKQLFITNYFNNFKEIKFKNIDNNIQQILENKEIITIHIRRGDKVVNDGGISNNIQDNELQELDRVTFKFIDEMIEKGNKNICFVSDEVKVKNNYISKYQDKCNVINFNGNDISQTYIDLYCLSKSKDIFVSQKFSVFSLLGYLIGNSNLYYIYEDSKFKQFSKYKNLINYK